MIAKDKKKAVKLCLQRDYNTPFLYLECILVVQVNIRVMILHS